LNKICCCFQYLQAKVDQNLDYLNQAADSALDKVVDLRDGITESVQKVAEATNFVRNLFSFIYFLKVIVFEDVKTEFSRINIAFYLSTITKLFQIPTSMNDSISDHNPQLEQQLKLHDEVNCIF
jgi:hypothetical protein